MKLFRIKPWSSWDAGNWPVVVLLLCLASTGLVIYELQRYNEQVVHAARERAVSQTLARIDTLLQRYQYGLTGARGAIALTGVDAIDRAAFTRYSRSRDYKREFPGARGFGFVRRVPQAQLPAYVAAQRQRNWPDFKIKQIQAHAGEHYVIELIEPFENNRAAIGLDIASESQRRSAALVAMKSGQATLTGPITLVQASGKHLQSFLMLLPAYDDPANPATASVIGWTYAPIVMGEVLGLIESDLPAGELLLTDVTDAGSSVRFYQTGARAGTADAAQRLHDIMGRKWLLTFRPAPQFIGQLNLLAPGYVASVGFLLSLLCCALTLAAVNHRARQRRLQATRAELAAIVESSVDAIIGSTVDGTVSSWNRGAEGLFGYAPEQAIGRPLAELIVPPELQVEDQEIVTRVIRNQAVSNRQTRRRDREGRMLDVSIAVAPIHNHLGAVVGVSTTVRDISALAAAQAAISSLNASLEQQVVLRTNELERARHDLRTVLDAVPTGIAYWDRSLTNRFANQSYGDFFGIDPARIPGMTMPELLGEELFKLNRAYVDAALAGLAQKFERAVAGPDGQMRYSLINYLPDRREGEVVGLYVIAHDVSDIVAGRQALASALRENEVLTRTINEQLLYSVTDAAGNILEVNDNFCAAVGYTRAQLIGANHRLLNDGQHDKAYWNDMWASISAGKTWRGEICNRTARGEARWFDTVIAPYFGEHGRIERYVSLRTDVTERMASDTALRRLSALLTNVLRAASEISIVATDTSGTITVFNTGAERMLGYTQEEMVGRYSPLRFHDPDDVAARTRELSARLGRPIAGFDVFIHVAEREGAETREWRYVRKDGSRIPVLLTVTSIRDDEGTLVGFLGVGVDISQRKHDEESQRLLTLHAEQASVAKSRFVANMSHEIRTPMNAVLGMLELIRRTELNARQREYIAKASSAGVTLMALLNDILDFSKIEAGKLELDMHPFDLDLLLRELAAVLAGNSVNKPVQVMFDLLPDIPRTLLGDRQRLQQVLVNLAGNALKFTEEGNVVVGMTVLARSEAEITLRISVSDTGIGIPRAQLDMIFDGFTQAEASTARRYGGTGLGLAISARLVRLMGSRLEVSSEPGRGSRFWFDVRFPIADPARTLADPSPIPLRTLIVDANAMSAAILHKLLQGLGSSACVAATVQQAQALLAESVSDGQPFDVVLLDQGVADLGTLEACWSALPGDRARPRLVLVSSCSAAPGTPSRQFDAPFSAFMSKPVTPAELLGVLVQAEEAAPAPPASRAIPVHGGRLNGVRVLVVEDNALNRQVASELLAHEGAIVQLAHSGRQGVDMATDRACRYDIVLMDVQMPDMDGLEATQRIRRVARTAHVPIVAMTANASTADRDVCLAAGMDRHIGKPFDIDQVVAVVRSLCGSAEVHEAADEAQAALAEPENDFDGALRRFSGNASIYGAMLDRFEAEAAHLIAQIERCQAAGDMTARAGATHALKGAALTIGANRLAALVTEPSDEAHAQAGAHADPNVLRAHAQQALHALRAAFAKRMEQAPPGVAAEAGDAGLSTERITGLLAELMPLLASGNLRALDLAQALALAARNSSPLDDIVTSVMHLRFSDAMDRVHSYLN